MSNNFKRNFGKAMAGIGLAIIGVGGIGNTALIADYLNPDLLQRVKDLVIPHVPHLPYAAASLISFPVGYGMMITGEKVERAAIYEDAIVKLEDTITSVNSVLAAKWSLVSLANGINPREFGRKYPDIEPNDDLKKFARVAIETGVGSFNASPS